MVCRLFFLFDMAPAALEVVGWVGGITALFAATIGLAQNDIKKVLAYSTVSQLGYMFLAAGLGAYSIAIFHLVTHAFFKACLFLGSGSVIHAMHGEQDMRKMGALRKKLPVVFWTFGFSTLALAGIAPLSGFFSKDAILAYAWQENRALWVMGFLGAGLTALYMSRLVCMTFFGNELRSKDEDGHEIHLHMPGWASRLPLIILAFLAVVGGALSIPHVMYHGAGAQWLEHFLEPVALTKKLTLTASTEYMLMGVSVLWAAGGLALGYLIYGKGPSKKMATLTEGPLRIPHMVLYGKWFVDEIYGVFVFILRSISQLLAFIVDNYIVDGILATASARIVYLSGQAARRLQTGNVQAYALVLVLATAGIVLWSM